MISCSLKLLMACVKIEILSVKSSLAPPAEARPLFGHGFLGEMIKLAHPGSRNQDFLGNKASFG